MIEERAEKKTTRVAILTQGFNTGGGIPATTRWLQTELELAGKFTVDIHDLATSSRDANSRRLLRPLSWFRRSLRHADGTCPERWGANGVEIEAMRYRPRKEFDILLSQYDIVQVISGSPALARVARRVPRPTFVLAASMSKWERKSRLAAMPFRFRVWRSAMGWLTSRADLKAIHEVQHVFTINSEMERHVRNLGQTQVTFSPPGVDVSLFTPNKKGWQRSGYLLSVCRLGDSRKGLDRLVLAYDQVALSMDDCPRLVIAGKGSLSPRVTALIERSDFASKIEVMSDVPLAGLPDLMRGASVFIQTSHEEGLGISVLEAMACGLPVVATRTAGSKETVLDGDTGWLLDQDDETSLPQRFANRIKSVKELEGQTMALNGRARCQALFSSGVSMARITDVYDQSMSQVQRRYSL